MSYVYDNRKQFDQTLAQIEELENSYVLVGFQKGDVTKSQNKGNRDKKPGMSMADIAAQNEFGTKNIPQRSFMRTSYDENRQKINDVVLAQYGLILEGNSTVKRSLNIIGLFVTDLIVQKIRAIQSPPNSPRTIKIKKSSKPLIDFGQMVQSVRHVAVIP